MAKAADKTIDVWKKKRWHRVLAPKLFNEMMIGETPALEPNMVAGRTLRINMMTLTGDIKKQSVDVTFEVDKVMGDTAYTHIKSFQISPSAVRRFIRKGKRRVDDSFVCLTADNVKVRIKPFMVTLSKTPNSVANALRRRARDFFVRAAKSMSYDSLCREIVTYGLQKSLRASLNKTYPLRVCDVRVLELYTGEQPPEAGSAAEAPQEQKAEGAESPAEEGQQPGEKPAEKKEEKEG